MLHTSLNGMRADYLCHLSQSTVHDFIDTPEKRLYHYVVGVIAPSSFKLQQLGSESLFESG